MQVPGILPSRTAAQWQDYTQGRTRQVRSAQHDGSVQINRDAAPPGGWEEFTVEDRGNNVVCLKSCHGKYLSAQQNGTAQWNRDHAPRGGWEDIQFVQQGATGQQQPATTTASMPSYVIVAQAGSPEVNGNYEFMPGKHENRHFSTIAGHYQHTQNPEIFIAFQDTGPYHQRPEWRKWMIISRAGGSLCCAYRWKDRCSPA